MIWSVLSCRRSYPVALYATRLRLRDHRSDHRFHPPRITIDTTTDPRSSMRYIRFHAFANEQGIGLNTRLYTTIPPRPYNRSGTLDKTINDDTGWSSQWNFRHATFRLDGNPDTRPTPTPNRLAISPQYTHKKDTGLTLLDKRHWSFFRISIRSTRTVPLQFLASSAYSYVFRFAR